MPQAPRPRIISEPAFGWRDPNGRPWVVKTTWAEVEGRAEVIGMELRSHNGERWGVPGEEGYVLGVPYEGATPMTASIWRSLNVGEIIEKQRRSQTRSLERLVGVPAHKVPEVWTEHLEALRTPAAKRGGRPPLEPGHFAKVAAVYAEAWRKGNPPTKAVAKHFKVADSTAAKWVMRARAMNLLGETTPGRPGAVSPRKPKKKASRKRRQRG